jgi:hypothetical protein
MELQIGPHLEETELEQYSMRGLPDVRLDVFEGHLLSCDTCQDKLLEMEAYINAMRDASRRLRQERPSFLGGFFRWPRLAWVGAMSVSAASVVAGILILAPRSPKEIVSVTLQASRGIAGPAIVQVPSGKGLSLNVDLTELLEASSYQLEVVDVAGQPVWKTVTQPWNGKISQPVPKGLRAGQYYVRLFLPGGPLLREFSLIVEDH